MQQVNEASNTTGSENIRKSQTCGNYLINSEIFQLKHGLTEETHPVVCVRILTTRENQGSRLLQPKFLRTPLSTRQ